MQDQERGSQGRILVVDQEEWCRAFLASVIKLLGIEDFKLVNTVAEASSEVGSSSSRKTGGRTTLVH